MIVCGSTFFECKEEEKKNVKVEILAEEEQEDGRLVTLFPVAEKDKRQKCTP